MEIQPSNSVGQATALFTGWTHEEVQNEIARIYPYPTINTLLFSKNAQEAITSTGTYKDFNEKNLIEAHRMLQGIITNPFQSVQDIPQSKADPFYYDAGLSEIQDLQQNTIGHPTGIPEVQDPRTAFISNQLKARIFRGQVDNELSKDYLNNLWLSQVDKGATYYQAQAIKQNEALNRYTADKLNAIKPIGSDTYIRNVNMGTINEKPHKDIKRNVVVRATPIYTSSSRHAKLNQLHNRFHSRIAQRDEAEKQLNGHVGNVEGTHPLLQLQNLNTHTLAHLGTFPHVYDGTLQNSLSGHIQHGEKRKREDTSLDDETIGSSSITGSSITGSSITDNFEGISTHYEDQITLLQNRISEQEALMEKHVEEEKEFTARMQKFNERMAKRVDKHAKVVDNIVYPLTGEGTPGDLDASMYQDDKSVSLSSFKSTISREDGLETKDPDPKDFETPSPFAFGHSAGLSTGYITGSLKRNDTGGQTTIQTSSTQLQRTPQADLSMSPTQLALHFEGESGQNSTLAAQVFNSPAPTSDPLGSYAPMQGGNDGFVIPYDDTAVATRTADARYSAEKIPTPAPGRLVDVTNIADILQNPIRLKKKHQEVLNAQEQEAVQYFKEKDKHGREYRGGVKEYKRVKKIYAKESGEEPFMSPLPTSEVTRMYFPK